VQLAIAFLISDLKSIAAATWIFGHEIALLAPVMGDEFLFGDVHLVGVWGIPEVVEPTVEELNIVLIDEKKLREAQQWVTACEQCAEDTPITFDYVLDAVTGCSPSTTEYVMCRPAKCPVCSGMITEKTLVVVA
jgi:hypothetical protein